MSNRENSNIVFAKENSITFYPLFCLLLKSNMKQRKLRAITLQEAIEKSNVAVAEEITFFLPFYLFLGHFCYIHCAFSLQKKYIIYKKNDYK